MFQRGVCTKVLSGVLVAPVHLEPVLGLPAGLQLLLCLLESPGQGVLLHIYGEIIMPKQSGVDPKLAMIVPLTYR